MLLLIVWLDDDTQVFDFDVSQIHWPTYLENYWLGVKRFALHEDINRLPMARQYVNRYVLWSCSFSLSVLYHKAAPVNTDR